ncbi:MAG: hypothetical protein H7Y16_06260 [Candidatus Parcubacteria bacterium]|nr:hypothetical protein [Burkholderiales bacterium]
MVISYYDQQPVDTLLGLLQSILDQPAGGAYDVCIVINETQDHRVDPVGLGFVPIVLHRPNTGMNIGAWDHGWRQNPGYGDYLFLQNECFAIAPLWLKGFRNRSEQVGAGLLGESMNEVWDSSWEQLRERQGVAVMREHLLDGEPANRVDVYLDFMKRHGISPGPTGLHLRSLVWFAGGELLAKLDGFPLGENYGECIASEIAVSRKVVSGGYALAQVGEKPFKFFRHREWKEKYPGGPFRHFRGGADGLS